MKLSERERILGLAVVSLLVLVTGFVSYLSVRNAFRSSTTQIENLQRQIQRQETLIDDGKLASLRIGEYEVRSLPRNQHEARARYQEWLLERVEKRFGKETTILGPSESSYRDIYYQFSYTISGIGNLQQLTDFLYDFYSLSTLHRIRSLNVQRIDDSKNLRLTLVIEALSIPTAIAESELNMAPGNRLEFAENALADYQQAVVGRNLFAPANRPPRLASINPPPATTKQPFSMNVQAIDDDPLDNLSFVLGEERPPDIKMTPVDAKSSRLSWTPPKAGTYPLTVLVWDDGFPPKSDSRTFEVKVSDPPPVVEASPSVDTKPKFDVAKFTVLIAVLNGRDGRPLIWLDEKPTGKRHTLYEGDEFSVGSVNGVIREIRIKDVLFEVNGKQLVLQTGEALLQAQDSSGGDISPDSSL